MSNIAKITRLAVFVDHDNFVSHYCAVHGLKPEQVQVWDGLSQGLVRNYQRHFSNPAFEAVEHVGTHVCVGVSDFVSKEEKEIKTRLSQLDRKNGFIITYGDRIGSYRDKDGNYRQGQEKGVDAEIICRMLMGAFLDQYDACVLMSDDSDFLPVVSRVQEYFGRKVIQAGFKDSKLRDQCYAHLAWERAGKDLGFGEQKPQGNGAAKPAAPQPPA
jgi:uncharacterized LabA/DUF88 family protein